MSLSRDATDAPDAPDTEMRSWGSWGIKTWMIAVTQLKLLKMFNRCRLGRGNETQHSPLGVLGFAIATPNLLIPPF
ncbi:MAG: hypothetical protein F6K31_05265 [Symploca sp. SIO2G7]|nr:hypothetical protein [Symploca sp. SIO2G7]